MLMLLLLLLQDDSAFTPETINAQIFHNGRRFDLVDVRIKGVQPYTFELRGKKSAHLVNLFLVTRIERLPNSQDFRVSFQTEEVLQGRIHALSFTGNPDAESGKRQSYQLSQVKRIHFVHGRQLRCCVQGHYEQFTAYPFCPVCGNPLQMGPYAELPKGVAPLLPYHTLRLDSRDPANSASKH